jgi:hypothetical protein
MAGRSNELAWRAKGVVTRCSPCVGRKKGGSIGQGRLVSKGGAEPGTKQGVARCKCKLRGSQGLAARDDKSGVVPGFLWPGTTRPGGAQKACGSKASGTLRYRLCVDGWMSSTGDASGVCQLRLRRTEIPPSPGKRIYPVPPVPPPAGFWVWRGGEGSRFAERAERGSRRKAARCSTRCGEAADCSEQQTESQPRAPARSHCGQCLRSCAARQSTRNQGRGDGRGGERVRKGEGTNCRQVEIAR